MSRVRGRIVPVLLAAAVLVGGANLAAYAVNGRPLLLGAVNTETRTALLANRGPGPALSLRSRATTPSLAVSSSKKVVRLNADRVDGLDGAALANRAHRYTLPETGAVSTFSVTLPGLPPGVYLASYSVVTLTSSADGNLGCDFVSSGAPVELINVGGNYAGVNSSASASGVLDTRARDYRLMCSIDTGTFSVPGPGDAHSQVSFLRLDDLQVADATPLIPRPGSGSEGLLR